MAAVKGKQLFEVPIGSSGNITCTQPAEGVYLVTFTSPPDNRLTTAFCQAFILALDIIEVKHAPGVVITTSGIDKFYSNGLDLEHATWTPGFWSQSLYALWRRLLTYSRPTIALMNGHSFAGALMVAMMHDYRIMNPHRGYLCLNELELGVPLRPPMSSIFRQKCSPTTYRKLILEAHRYKALDALKEGIVDHLGGLPEALSFIEELKLVKKAQPPMSGGDSVYGVLKREMWRETADYLEKWNEESNRDFEIEQRRRQDAVASRKRVKEWELKSKL